MADRRLFHLILLIVLLASSSAVVLTYSLVTKTLTTRGTISIPNPPTIVNMGFYIDKNFTIPLTSIDWGTLTPGSSKTYAMYLRNEGNVGLTLGISMTNVNPTALSSSLSLTTNYDGHIISPGEVFILALTLNVASSIAGTGFTFDVAISYG